MNTRRARGWFGIGAAFCAVLIAAGAVWLAHRPTSAPRPVYTAQGYGGYVVPPSPRVARKPAAARPAGHDNALPPDTPDNPLAPLDNAYATGHYAQAETQARQVIVQSQRSHNVAAHRQAAEARQVLAYAIARQAVGKARPQKMAQARVEFAALQKEAAALPDKGKPPLVIGADPQPTLEEEAAYEHAVCTGALGNTQAAEAEYRRFMQDYPDSPLVSAAMKRIARLHGGNIPQADQAIWQKAKQAAQAQARAKQREQSLCAPECLAQLLQRQGKPVSVPALAAEMGTSDQGTSVAALVQAAQKHGFSARGLALTPKGLAEQALPVIALIAPGHFVIVDAVTPTQVTVWDPDALGIGKGAARQYTPMQWKQVWSGVTLALHGTSHTKLSSAE